MKRTSLVALAAAVGLLATSAPALAAGVAYPDADWTQANIPNPDGTTLHADILRPKGFKDTDKTPVIVSIGPYFNHSGQVGAAGDTPLESGVPYDPVGPSAGPSERFADFVEGSHLLDPNRPGGAYTFVMVDLRGYGGSSGCPDWGGPGEQSDVVSAVEWAGTQPWSTGAVATYGKSYDGMTGLIAAANWAKAPHLKAVVSQEPVYDDYRYLYGDGMRRENFAATPALYDSISLTPGPLADDPTYSVQGSQENLARPGCHAGNWGDQALDDDHFSPYWRARNLIAEVKGSPTPLFVTQGMTENNTAPDGFAEFLANHTGPERGWLGPWNHVRGNDMDGAKLAMGRKGWFDEVMSFYDQYLKGIAPSAPYPPFAVQSVTTGRWRPELEWPPADATPYTSDLAPGTYSDSDPTTDRADSTGAWTVSKPLPYDLHLAGAGTVTVDVSSTVPRANLVVDVYDLDASGKGPLVARQGALVRDNGPVTLRLMSADWRFRKGHRIGIRVTNNNFDWWIAAIPSQATVTVYGGTATLPFLRYDRTQVAQGDSGTTRAAWLTDTAATAPADAVANARDFTLPPPLAPEPADMRTQLDGYAGR